MRHSKNLRWIAECHRCDFKEKVRGREEGEAECVKHYKETKHVNFTVWREYSIRINPYRI